jgi:threonine synthase
VTIHECRNCGFDHDRDLGQCPRCGRPVDVDREYLERIEALAKAVVATADETYGSLLPADPDGDDLKRACGALAAELRHWHFHGDGCLEDEDDQVQPHR